MARGARLLAVARGEPAVEELPAVDDGIGRGIEADRGDGDAGQARGREGLELVVEPAHHVEPRPRRIGDHAGRARHGRDARDDGARAGGIDHAELVGGERGHEDALAVGRPAHPGRHADRRVGLGLGAGRDGVVDLWVEADQRARLVEGRDDGEPLFGHVSAHVGLEADLELGVGPGHGEGAGHRVGRRAHHDAGDVGARRLEGVGGGVEIDHLVERHLVGDLGVPQVARRVGPVLVVLLEHEAGLGRGREPRRQRRVGRRQRVAGLGGRERRGLGARVEDVHDHLAAIQVAGEGTRHAPGDRDHDRGGREVGGVVDLDRVLLRDAHVRLVGGPREHHVAGLIPDAQRGAGVERGEVDDAHVVGEVVDHPGLAVGARGDRDRLEPHRDLGDPDRAHPGHVEHREPRVGGVHD